MTRAERKWQQESKRLWKQFLVIVGMAHPELQSAFEPGWTKSLPTISDPPFDGSAKSGEST